MGDSMPMQGRQHFGTRGDEGEELSERELEAVGDYILEKLEGASE